MKSPVLLLHHLACFMLTAASLTAAADNTLRGRRLKLTPKALTSSATTSVPADTFLCPGNEVIALSGYDKPLQSAYEAFLLTNHSERHAERVALTITYYDMSGRQLHERSDTLPVAVPPAETRLVKIPTWDTQRSYYYHKGKRPRTARVTPYSIRARVDFVLLRPSETSDSISPAPEQAARP